MPTNKNTSLTTTFTGKDADDQVSRAETKNIFPVYPDGLAMNYKEQEEDLNTRDTTEMNEPDERTDNDIDEEITGTDLDVPGSELDNEQEDIGSEDEENNYYSLGGDDHNNLDENNA